MAPGTSLRGDVPLEIHLPKLIGVGAFETLPGGVLLTVGRTQQACST
jgi:hypothetical protein